LRVLALERVLVPEPERVRALERVLVSERVLAPE
jgi:hypothetical protein